jgi:hypothetical protein
MMTLWCKNKENPSDRISHIWAPLSGAAAHGLTKISLTKTSFNRPSVMELPHRLPPL